MESPTLESVSKISSEYSDFPSSQEMQPPSPASMDMSPHNDDEPVAAGSPPASLASEARVLVNIEASVRTTCTRQPDHIRSAITKQLEDLGITVFRNGNIDFASSDFLRKCLRSLRVCDLDDEAAVPFWKATLNICVYQCNQEGGCDESTGTDEAVTTCRQWVLPCEEFGSLWDNLIYDSSIKRNLLGYASTAMAFADKGVDKTIITWNRLVLLHGPPGTGKTSLAKALAQKLSIRLGNRYPSAQLLEVNAHSLFSKWFSESGKLVMRLFEHIQELVDDEESFVCILIDEVESLSAARASAVAGTEPSDAVRVVNALLTQIDRLRAYKNVLVISTSNITEAIDVAFVDRADIKQYIGLPSERARYEILRSCMNELSRAGIVHPPAYLRKATGSKSGSSISKAENALRIVAGKTEGLSGRALRKLPVQAHAFFLHGTGSVSVLGFLKALLNAAAKERRCRSQLKSA